MRKEKEENEDAKWREGGGLDSAIFATRIIISYLARPVASGVRCVRLPRLLKKNM